MVNNHYFINDTTDLTAYSLEHYDEVKDIDDCNLIYKKTNKYYNKEKQNLDLLKHFNYSKYWK